MKRTYIIIGVVVLIMLTSLFLYQNGVFQQENPQLSNNSGNQVSNTNDKNNNLNNTGDMNTGSNNNTANKKKIKEGIGIGDRAPDFKLNKMNGESISLGDLRGKKVFLNFWATWCPPCKAEIPDIQKLYNQHKDVEILAVNLQESNDKVVSFMFNNNYHFPVVLDKTGRVAGIYAVRGIPTTYILDEKGVILDKTSGALTYDRMIKMLGLNEK